MKVPSIHFEHRFVALKREKVESYGTNVFLLFRDVEDTIRIQDKLIVNNSTFLSGFHTFCGNYSQEWFGLGYWGVTIIPHESLLQLIEQINNDKNKKQLNDLLLLCQNAWKENLDVIHMGL